MKYESAKFKDKLSAISFKFQQKMIQPFRSCVVAKRYPKPLDFA